MCACFGLGWLRLCHVVNVCMRRAGLAKVVQPCSGCVDALGWVAPMQKDFCTKQAVKRCCTCTMELNKNHCAIVLL